jgi:DNA-binding NarL/FixJ family response regulator
VSACASIVDMLADSDLGQHSEYLGMLAWTEVNLERFAAARRHFTRGAELVRQLGTLHQVPTMLLGLSVTALQVGEFDKATAAAAEAARLAAEMGADQLRGLALARESTCALAVERDCGRALALAEEALASLPRDSVYGQPEAVLALASAVLADGDPLRCTALILSLGGPNLDGIPLIDRALCYDRLTEAAVALGDLPAARRWTGAAASAAAATGLRSQRGHALSAQGHLRRAEGDAEGAVASYADAAELFSEVRMSAARIRALVAAAGSSAVEGDAALFMALARELVASCGAWGDYERAQAAHPQTWSARPDVLDGPVTAVLTSREAEIAWLAAKGERTKDIAKDLFLSPRTVETHLSRIYRKMNVKSRAALAGALRLGTSGDATVGKP